MVVSFIFPNSPFVNITGSIARIVINIGHYLLYPLLFFGLVSTMAASTQRWQCAKINLNVLFFSFLTTSVATLIGGVSVLIIKPSRIPLIYQTSDPFVTDNIAQLAQRIFPQNLFAVFSGPGSFFLPLLILALILGLALRYNRDNIEISTRLFAEGAQLFRTLNLVYLEFIGIGLIVLAINTAARLQNIADISIYIELIFIMLIQAIVMILIVLPLIGLLWKMKKNPYRLLLEFISPALTAMTSGDTYYTAPLLLKSMQDTYKPTDIAPYAVIGSGLFLVRAGSALFTSTLIFVVLQSYSALDIGLLSIARILLTIIVISPLASTSPQFGVLYLLTILTQSYEQGIENSFLIILPLAPLIVMLVALVDTVSLGYIGYLATERSGISPSIIKRTARHGAAGKKT